jgi:hypothetical protein
MGIVKTAMTQQNQKERTTMGKMKQLAIDLDNVEKLVTDALRNAAMTEQEFFFQGDTEYSKKFFEQVTLPLHQIVAFLRNGDEVDYV